jgi:hypothetical protein
MTCHEDNQATILVVRKGFSPKLRHVSRTHKVNLGSLTEVFNNSNVALEYISTEQQAADIFTKALPPQKWGSALKMLGIVDFNKYGTRALPTTVLKHEG